MPIEKDKTKKGGARPGAGRKPFVPTPTERKQVETMAGLGLRQPEIALLVRDGISLATLLRHFRRELTRGTAKASSQVAQSLYQQALAGNTTAAIWWTKARMGWSEKVAVDHTSSDGSMSPPTRIEIVSVKPEFDPEPHA